MSKNTKVIFQELKLLKDDIKGCEIKEVTALVPHLGVGHPNPQQHLLEHIENIEKQLTPPTSDEVCKELSEYYKQEVRYMKGYEFCYLYSGPTSHILDSGIRSIKLNDFIKTAPHLITLIGRFYQGLEESKHV